MLGACFKKEPRGWSLEICGKVALMVVSHLAILDPSSKHLGQVGGVLHSIYSRYTLHASPTRS